MAWKPLKWNSSIKYFYRAPYVVKYHSVWQTYALFTVRPLGNILLHRADGYTYSDSILEVNLGSTGTYKKALEEANAYIKRDR